MYHPACSRHMDAYWYPTRLLDVSQDPIRLRLSQEEQITGPYATLSHCWGRNPFWVLTSATMPRLLAGVPLESFKRSFQEAIQITRRLGIDYLWIDCYCIVQEQDHRASIDWESEAALMGQVYGNGLVNIAAAGASNPSQGLFAVRDSADWLLAYLLRWLPTTDCPVDTYMLKIKDEDSTVQFDRLSKSPLFKRAWVIQEAVLSRRMLSFNGAEILWQCSETAACEFFPSGMTADAHFRQSAVSLSCFWSLKVSSFVKSWYQLPPTQSSKHAPGNWRTTIWRGWLNALQSYCIASLTYPDKDVYKAIAGVGQQVAKLAGCDYYGGFLSDTFLVELVWETIKSKQRSSRRKIRAPSWHWASQYGNVVFLLQTRLTSVAYRSMAYAFVSDECKPYVSNAAADLWPSLFCVGKLIKVNLKLNATLNVEVRNSYWHRQPFSLQVGGIDVEIWLDEHHQSISGSDNITLLPLTHAIKRDSDLYCLLLCEIQEGGAYARIGIGRTWAIEAQREWTKTRPSVIEIR
ncbi:MAG: hypothetical protein Q9227_002121 [Pyrenula ochraceoflavens]